MTTAFTESLADFLNKLDAAAQVLKDANVETTTIQTEIITLKSDIKTASQNPSGVSLEEWQGYYAKVETIHTKATKVKKVIT
jgi:hypothetical protein